MKSENYRQTPTSRRPRLKLTKIAERWKGGDRRSVQMIIDRTFRSFSTEMVRHKPTGLRGFSDLLDLFSLYRDEILAAVEKPFNDDPDPESERAAWREMLIEAGFVIAVPYGKDVLHVQEMFLYGLRLTSVVFDTAWTTYWETRPEKQPPHDSWVGKGDEDRENKFYAVLREHAQKEAAHILGKIEKGLPLFVSELLANPPISWHSVTLETVSDSPVDKNSALPKERSASPDPAVPPSTDPNLHISELIKKWGVFHDNWGAPPAKPDPNEPFMRDGSHLLASERGRRKIDPVTGKRMIHQMVLTPDAWPHYEWVEDVEGEFGVGPHGPDCRFGMPDDPRMLSPRESWRPYLEKIGRLDLLHNFMPGPNDADQSNPPEPYYCYPKDYTGPRK